MQQDFKQSDMRVARVLSEGGRVSVQQMALLLEAARAAGLTHMRVDARQSLIFNHGALPTRVGQLHMFAQHLADVGLRCAYEHEQNIVSSVPSVQVFAHNSWVDSGVYGVLLRELHEVGIGMGSMDAEVAPAFPLSVSLVDGRQHFVPHLSSELNFVASDTEDYWYVYIRYGQADRAAVLWPFLVGSPCLAQFAYSLAHDLAAGVEVSVCAGQYAQDARWQMIALEQAVAQPYSAVPRYEGFIPYGQNQYALGIVRADQSFEVLMLEYMLKLMQQQDLVELYTTPWGSLLIKGIHEAHIPVWNRLLCLQHCDVGLSYGQLNWLILADEANHADGVRLRNHLAQQLQDNGLRTWGLGFAIVDEASHAHQSWPTSIIVRVQRDSSWFGWRKRVCYALWCIPADQSLAQQYHCIAEGLDLHELVGELTDRVIKHQKSIGVSRQKAMVAPLTMPTHWATIGQAVQSPSFAVQNTVKAEIFVCRHCATEYHEDLGEPSQNIAAHTPFAQLNEQFHCPVCEHGKSAFEPLLRSA